MRVLKFGGATVATPAHILNVAKIIEAHVRKGESLIVVVSAMGKTTSDLLKLSQQVSSKPHRRELDMLLSVGERITMSLLSMALNDLKVSAVSLTGSQAGILTTEDHENAEIIEIKPIRVESALKEGKTVIVAGFQGVSAKTKEITTLGRGGSDLTAIALAAYFQCPCDIMKEMSAVFCADPRIFPKAQQVQELDYETLEIMTNWGAQMLNSKAAHLAREKKVELHFCKAELESSVGTKIVSESSFQKTPQVLINHHRALLRFSFSKTHENPHSFLENFYDQNQLHKPNLLHTYTDQQEKILWTVEHPDSTGLIRKTFQGRLKDFTLDDHNWMSFSILSSPLDQANLKNSMRDEKNISIMTEQLSSWSHTLVLFPENELQNCIQKIQDIFKL